MVASTESDSGLTRREFLYYIWGASIALFTVEFTGLLIWFMLPRFREGEFGGSFTLSIDVVPDVNGAPYNFPDGRFWLANLDSGQPNERMYEAPDEDQAIVGTVAIYKVCTHLGCIYAWTSTNNRFECPCHGSKYRLDGRRIEDPAPRNLDRFKLTALDANEQELASSGIQDNSFVPVVLPPETAYVRIDTGDKLSGPSQALLGNM